LYPKKKNFLFSLKSFLEKMTQVDKLRDDFAREHPGASAEDLRLVQDLTGDIQGLDFSTPENVQDRSAAT
jgi:hypothetical protein